MNYIPGCPTCQAVIPEPVSVDLPDGSRVVHQTCQPCGYVWARREYTDREALACDRLAALEKLFTDLIQITQANRGSGDFLALEGEVRVRYGPVAAAAMRCLVAEVFEAETASRAVVATRLV